MISQIRVDVSLPLMHTDAQLRRIPVIHTAYHHKVHGPPRLRRNATISDHLREGLRKAIIP